ncbi:RtcB family protein [Streptomyces sp. JV185]|uniref:RtcB family protein n=1 Tax=Streptomyces sp. JV185 TaxID=858638 RepID=UPI002E7762BE|nr:RtcB family protein [Streptomyces sp. JV185]MEE1767461.1 RtcB family protein [Streptomyces sp. JV185]
MATLPGTVRASYAMPDIHWGYGFPIGGVAVTEVASGGVISPGGVGFDISCGVRLLTAHMDRAAPLPKLPALMDRLDGLVPRGLGRGGLWHLTGRAQLHEILCGGARYAVEQGHGVPRDLERCEDGGAVGDAGAAARCVTASTGAWAGRRSSRAPESMCSSAEGVPRGPLGHQSLIGIPRKGKDRPEGARRPGGSGSRGVRGRCPTCIRFMIVTFLAVCRYQRSRVYESLVPGLRSGNEATDPMGRIGPRPWAELPRCRGDLGILP